MNWKSVATGFLLVSTLVFEPSGLAFSASVPSVEAADKGLVVFYRTRKPTGAGIHFRVFDGSGGVAGILKNGSMFHRQYEPGQKTFDVSTQSVAGSDLITLDIRAGETIFVRGEILLGWPVGRPKFTLVPESQARADIAKL